MSFVASYGTKEPAEAAAIKKLTNRDTISPTVDVMVVYADTGEVVFRGKR